MPDFNRNIDIFIPDGAPVDTALPRTTDMCVGAHPDDIEIMCYHAIAECMNHEHRWFCGVTVTDGAGSARYGKFDGLSSEELADKRAAEQKSAAKLGQYGAQILMGCTSNEVKTRDSACTSAIAGLIAKCAPSVVYTHNLADTHDTHVAVALRVIDAIRQLDPAHRPKRLIGLECWRGLDWVCGDERITFDSSRDPDLAGSLISSHETQLAAGRRFDLAALGRRQANAVFSPDLRADAIESAILGVDMTPLIIDDRLDPRDYARELISRLEADVISRIGRFSF